MALFYGIAGLLWIYCIFDVIRTPDGATDNLPRMTWLLIVVFVPTVGSIAWLTLGKPGRQNPAREYRPRHPPAPGRRSLPTGPEDSPEFMRDAEQRRLRAWEEDLRRREEELRKQKGDDGA